MSVPDRITGKPKHLYALDGVRGIAILLVLFCHFFFISTPSNLYEFVLQKLGDYGNLGVDLFFVLSGFLITGILMDTKGKENYFKNFIIRRSLRIFPLYYFVLIIIFLIMPLFSIFNGPLMDRVLEGEVYAWTYTYNFFIAEKQSWPPFIGHFWSLAVEEQFYLVWPLAVYLLSTEALKRFSWLLIFVSIVAFSTFEYLGYSMVVPYVHTFTRMGVLCAGALIAIYYRSESLKGNPNGMRNWAFFIFLTSILIKVGVILAVKWNPSLNGPIEVLRSASWSGLFTALVMAAIDAKKGSPLERTLTIKPLMILGKYSYGLYVYHALLTWPLKAYKMNLDLEVLVGGNSSLAWTVQFIVGTMVSLGLSYVSFHVLENKFIKLKDVFAPSSSAVKLKNGSKGN